MSCTESPEFVDTTSIENLIKKHSYQDHLAFVRDSVLIFAQMRGEVEKKRQPIKKQNIKIVEIARERLRANRERPPLLDFATRYPIYPFYQTLEQEIDIAYASNLPNAALVLSRKLVENLLYEILNSRFPKEVKLRYIPQQGRAQDFGTMIDNLQSSLQRFARPQQDAIITFLGLVKPFRREANGCAHSVMQYVSSTDELDQLKIPELVSLELYLIENIRATRTGIRAD